MASTKEQMILAFEAALNYEADKVVDPAQARKRIAEKLGNAVSDFVIGRQTQVPGVYPGSSMATGTIQ